MQTRWLKRTILIGLGGTGKKALLQAKRKLVETFGEVPPLIKFLMVDTTSAHTDGLQARTPSGESQSVRLNPSEVLFIEARGASLLPKVHDEIMEWFPPSAELKANILSGAGQVRALGRLALFANARIVYDSLRDLVAQARDYRAERHHEDRNFIYQAYSSHLTVCVVGSLAGGTGSGTYLDIALILRDILKDEDQLFGYLLLPDIYTNRPGTQNVEANAYGALKELDHFMNLQETTSYTFGGRRIEVRKKPFDMVFLVNRQNRGGKTFNNIDDLAELLGLGLFLVSGPLGKEQADVFDNIVMQLAEQQGSFYGKTAHYASFGVAELLFDPTGIKGQSTLELAKQTVSQLQSSNRPWGFSDVREVIDQLSQLPLDYEIPLPKASDSAKEDQSVWQRATSQIESAKDRATEECRRQLREGWKPELALQQALQEGFNSHSVAELLQGVGKLQTLVQELIQNLKEKLKEAQEKQEVYTHNIEQNLKSAGSAGGGFLGLGRRGSEDPQIDRRVLNSYKNHVWEIVKIEARIEAAEQLSTALQGRQEKLSTVLVNLESWLQNLESKIKYQMQSASQDNHPFTLTLPPPYLKAQSAEVQPSAVLERIRSKGLEQLLSSFGPLMNQEFNLDQNHLLRGYLETTLSSKDPKDPQREAVERTLRELDVLSSPAWEYQDAWVANPKVGQREQVHILGLEDAADLKHPLLQGVVQDIFASNIHAKQKLQYVSTGDPNRVYFYKIEASIPAFTLWGLDTYREKYLRARGNRTFHIHKDWETQVDDLLPLPKQEQVVRVWTMGRLFDLIHDNPYRYLTKRDGQQRSVSLPPRLAKAFEGFATDFFAYKELEAEVDRRALLAKRTRYPELKEAVKRAQDDRSAKLSQPNTDFFAEDLKVIEQEREVLQQWLKELELYDPAHSEDAFPVFA